MMSNLPSELTERPQWLKWYETDDGGKRPIGKSNDPSTWCHYDDIATHDRIAFVIAGSDPFTGIDLDGCLDETGAYAPWAQEIMQRFLGVAYAEISPSGKGVKLITRARKPDSARCTHKIGEGKTQIECYDHERFWTITKNVIQGLENIGDGQAAIDWLCEKYLKGDVRKTGAKRLESSGSMPSLSLLSRVQAYCDKVPGGTAGELRNSAFKLSGNLHAFVGDMHERLTDNDVYHLLRSWNARNSPPMREDELQEAARNGRTNGTPPANKEPTKAPTQKNGHPPSDKQATIETGFMNAKDIDPATAADKFIKQNLSDGKPRIAFWSGGFLYWTKGRYIHLPNSEIKAKLVLSLNRNYCKVKAATITDVMEHVRALSIVSTQVQPPSWLCSHSWKPEDLIATENSIVHLPSFIDGEPQYSITSTPSLFTTCALDYKFEKSNPDCPGWKAFLSQLWPDDPQSIDVLQEWFGYSLTPDTSQQKILMVIGPRRSGKGTIARVLRSVVGEGNVCGPTLSSLQTNFGLWPLLGKTVAIINDARLGGRADQAIITERLLSISGEDAQTIDRKNMEPVTTKLTSRFTIISNELPRLQDSSGALSGRMILLRMTETF